MVLKMSMLYIGTYNVFVLLESFALISKKSFGFNFEYIENIFFFNVKYDNSLFLKVIPVTILLEFLVFFSLSKIRNCGITKPLLNM